MQSIRADVIISLIPSSVDKWTGNVITKSQVDVVGLHLQSGWHPWRNWHLIRFKNPRGGMLLAPVNHCSMSSTKTFGISITLINMLLDATWKWQNLIFQDKLGTKVTFWLFSTPTVITFHFNTIYKVTKICVCLSLYLVSKHSIKELAVTACPFPETNTGSQILGCCWMDANKP